MPILYVRSIIKSLLLIAIAIAMSACFKKPGDQALPSFDVSINVDPVYNYTALLESVLHASGACNGNSSIVFTYSSELASSQTVELACKGDKLDGNFPVQ